MRREQFLLAFATRAEELSGISYAGLADGMSLDVELIYGSYNEPGECSVRISRFELFRDGVLLLGVTCR